MTTETLEKPEIAEQPVEQPTEQPGEQPAEVKLEKKLYTVTEFLALEWPDEDEEDYELIGGEIVAKPKGGVSAEHGDIVARVSLYLGSFAGVGSGEKRLGKVYTGASCNLGQGQSGSYMEPDVCFVLEGRTPARFKGAIPVVPDLVCEVWSPSDTTEKIQNKIEAYQRAGARLIWSIYMLSQFIVVYEVKQAAPKFRNIEEELDAGDIIPGFRLPVRDLFA